jgi:hypothetical protein
MEQLKALRFRQLAQLKQDSSLHLRALRGACFLKADGPHTTIRSRSGAAQGRSFAICPAVASHRVDLQPLWRFRAYSSALERSTSRSSRMMSKLSCMSSNAASMSSGWKPAAVRSAAIAAGASIARCG